jgi:hypothetical protein
VTPALTTLDLRREFDLLPVPLQDTAYPLLDQEGRPCGEGNATDKDAALAALVEMSVAACPYAGHRYQRPMNVSALRQVVRYWNEVLAWLPPLRVEFLAGSPGELPTLAELWKFAKALAAGPAYLARRAHQPLDSGELSPRIAVLFKLVQGVNLTINHFVDPGSAPFGSIVPPDLSTYAEEHELFLSASGGQRVCSGSARMIDLLLSSLLGRGGDMPRGSSQISGEFADVREAMPYGLQVAALEISLWLFAAQNELVLARLQSALGRTGASTEGRRAELAKALASAAANMPRDTDRLQLMPTPPRAATLVPELSSVLGQWLQGDESENLPTAARLLEAPSGPAGADLDQIMADYLALERAGLAVFSVIQARITRARGGSDDDARSSALISPADLCAVYPRALRSVLESWGDPQFRW